MTSADEYRVKAADMISQARQASDPVAQAACECLAQRYLRLAEMAEMNALYESCQKTANDADGECQIVPSE